MGTSRAQVTIFIIIAVVLVAVVVGFFIFRGGIKVGGVPASLEPAYNSFLNCLEEDALVGINVLESQGGYIELPDFEPGSSYMPFSSQLNFLGNPIPYWYYVSGNNIEREQVPSESDMESELEDYLEGKIRSCVLDKYYEEGFEINFGEPDANVNIRDNEVEVNLNMDMSLVKEEDSANIDNHKVIVKSKLGGLYDSARKIYEKEQDDLFLENYGVDVLRIYAPVDGVEISCAPETWIADEVFDELENAIEANTMALKIKGGDYSLTKEKNKYFILDIDVPSGQNVLFLNSKQWPNNFEVAPAEGNVLMANPVGNQPGLGILGFCYVPYHFIYNVKYPVLVQVYGGEEIFQFPVAVVIQGNTPRKALEGSAVEIELSELCKYKNTQLSVNVYDTNLRAVDAEISYECFGTRCYIGETVQGSLSEKFPQCVNGYVVARAEGYADAEYLYSTTSSGSVDIIMDKLYEKEIQLKLDGRDYSGEAIISFVSDKNSKTLVYPQQRTVELSEGQYEIQVQIFSQSSLKLEGSKKEQCLDVPQTGLGGFFGLTKEECFEIEIPSQVVSSALAGGGRQNYYILESELAGGIVEINARGLPLPGTIEQLQENYLLFEEKDLDIYFK